MEIIPYKSMGKIVLNTHQQEIRECLGLPDEERPTISDWKRDYYDTLGLMIEYDGNLLCVSVEASEPANPSLEGFTFIGKPFSEIRPFLESRDPDFDEDDDGITSYKLGIALYIPDFLDGDTATVESIMVFRKGYYELGRELLQKEEEEALNSANSSKENTILNRVKSRIKRLLKLE